MTGVVADGCVRGRSNSWPEGWRSM